MNDRKNSSTVGSPKDIGSYDHGTSGGRIETDVRHFSATEPQISEAKENDLKGQTSENTGVGFLRGGRLMGGGVGGGTGAFIGGIVGCIVPGAGTAAGIVLGAGIGAAIGSCGAAGGVGNALGNVLSSHEENKKKK